MQQTQILPDLSRVLTTLSRRAQELARHLGADFVHGLADASIPLPRSGAILNLQVNRGVVQVAFTVPTETEEPIPDRARAIARHLGTQDVRKGTPYSVHRIGTDALTKILVHARSLEIIFLVPSA
jgi:hypothetical protein